MLSGESVQSPTQAYGVPSQTLNPLKAKALIDVEILKASSARESSDLREACKRMKEFKE